MGREKSDSDLDVAMWEGRLIVGSGRVWCDGSIPSNRTDRDKILKIADKNDDK